MGDFIQKISEKKSYQLGGAKQGLWHIFIQIL